MEKKRGMNMKREEWISPEGITQLYLAVMMTAFLLWTGMDGYARITFYKAAAFCILTGGYVAVMLRAVWREKVWSKFCPAQWLIVGYWGMSVLSSLCALDRERAFFGGPRAEGLLSISLYCGAFLLVSVYGRPQKWMLALFGIGMSGNCAVALAQLAGYNPLRLYPAGLTYFDGHIRYAGQFLGTVGNVDLLSALLCVAVPVFWIALLRVEDKRRFRLLIPLGLCLCVLGLTWVEGGVLGVLGGFVLALPVVLRERGQRKAAFLGAVLAMLGALAVVYVFGGDMSGALFEAHELLHGRFDERFGSGRLYIWRETWKLVPERLLLGGGPETLGLRTQAAFERFDETLGLTIRTTVDNAHNEYLNILVNQGLMALGCWLGALLSAAVLWRKKAPAVPAAAICGGGVLGYCIQAFFGLSSPITAPFFWLAFGLLIRATRE